ncbi:MAG: amidohydrolase family protein [bacterium]|nr:amidohydrolase family protein [bacterium]
MRFRRQIAPVSLILAVCFVCAGPATAERPEPPPYYAVRDARVVTAAGDTLERATVLIADGLIEALGTDLAIPTDAWVIEGEGLTLYPGLIDAMTDLAQKREEAPGRAGSGGGRPGGAPRPTIRGPEDRPATTPWVSAAQMLGDGDDRVAQWREAGFTAAVSVPTRGFFAGQASLVHLGDSEPKERVLATPVAQRISFRSGGGGFRSFPGSLMGGISYVRQVLSDARHEAIELELYERSPNGRQRPIHDRALEPIRHAITGRLPFLMPADHGREIDRVLQIAAEAEIVPVLYGGQGAYARVDALAESRTPVLVSLDWPEADKDADPDADTPLPMLHHRRKAPATPGMLADAGVPFAFTSDGLSSPAKIFEGVRAATGAGLSNDDALAALTLDAARILGVDDRLGSIEAGKIANLVLATAEPWIEDAEVRAVFVDGRKYEQRKEDEDAEPPATDVSGTWALQLETPGGVRDMTADLKMTDDGKVTGDLTSQRGTVTVDDGRMSGDRLSFETTRTMGPRTVTASYSLTVAEDNVEGTLRAGPRSMEITGERTAEASEAEAEDGEEPAVSTEELERAMALYSGPIRDGNSFAITGATVYTVSGETLEDATVVVDGGKIRAIGTGIEIPPGIEAIDADGGSVIPGIIDAHSHIAIEGGGNEGSVAVSAMVSIQDVIEPEDIAIYRALAGGVTTVNVLHGSANPIGGGNAVLKLRWGSDAGGLRFEGAPSGIKFALGENPKRSRSNPPPGVERRYPATRMGVMDVIRQAFEEARDYRADWQRYESSSDKNRLSPRRDLKLERLAEVLAGERLVHAHCYRADEILQLLRLAEDFDFRIATLQHVLEGYKVADEIAAHGAGASTFSDWWGYKVEAYDAIPHNAALMAERGVMVSINSDSGEEMRHLNQEAAKAVKWGGLDEIEALKLVTLNPALQLGIGDSVGSIEVGKDADLVLYDGHPLSIFSVVQKTFVDGVLYFDRNADRERQAAIDAVKEKLAPEEDEETTEERGEEEEAPSPPESRVEDIHYSCREVGP